MSLENSNDTVGNRTRDLPACSAVPEPTAPPRTPTHTILVEKWGYVKVVLCSENDMLHSFVINLREVGFEDMMWVKLAGDHGRYW
jgi:hypothetical protein